MSAVSTLTALAPTAPEVDATRPLLPVVGGELVVPTVTGASVRYALLDYAASAPSLQAVADHVAAVLPYYSSVHRGAGFTSQVSTALYEGARDTIGEFVGARSDDVVVITRNTTDSLNLLAQSVPATANGTGEVVFLDVEHHANLLPWAARGHRCVAAAPTVQATLSRLEAELRRRPAALLAVTGCSNVTGEILPLRDLVRIAHLTGARVCIDAAQLAPHRRIDLAALGADYLALSGHKLYAPFGAGALIGRRDWLDEAPAYLAGGGAVRDVTVARAHWAPAPQRHEAGSPNVLGAAALAAACQALGSLPEGALEAHEAALTARLLDGLAQLPGVSPLQIWEDSTDRAGVVGFRVEGHDPARVAAYLSAEHGIGVRDGRFCAHPLLSRLGTGDGALRASVGVGSRAEDVDRLVAALRTLLTTGESWTYAEVDGRWAPSPDTRPAPAFLGVPVLSGTPAAGASPCEAGF
ncbi:MAG: aminotransferase class V-fold PLP-dependent enzyme [Kineosporiaceae bacterium]